jgi:hypothetical protein
MVASVANRAEAVATANPPRNFNGVANVASVASRSRKPLPDRFARARGRAFCAANTPPIAVGLVG